MNTTHVNDPVCGCELDGQRFCNFNETALFEFNTYIGQEGYCLNCTDWYSENEFNACINQDDLNDEAEADCQLRCIDWEGYTYGPDRPYNEYGK